MTFNMIYDKRNRDNLNKLADNTRIAAYKLYQYCSDNKIQILIYETIRTVEQQRKNVASGASQTMQSYHLVGQALDWVLIDSKGEAMWGGYKTANADKVVNYAKRLGFESGRDWGWDAPHLQFNYKGYGTDTFGKIKGNGDELTMNQYNELKGLLDKQSKEIDQLKEQLKNKAEVQSNVTVDVSHKGAWDWAIKEGIIKGDGASFNPAGTLSRQQMATMLKRYHDKLFRNCTE